jgi:hypothetical protein
VHSLVQQKKATYTGSLLWFGAPREIIPCIHAPHPFGAIGKLMFKIVPDNFVELPTNWFKANRISLRLQAHNILFSQFTPPLQVAFFRVFFSVFGKISAIFCNKKTNSNYRKKLA